MAGARFELTTFIKLCLHPNFRISADGSVCQLFNWRVIKFRLHYQASFPFAIRWQHLPDINNELRNVGPPKSEQSFVYYWPTEEYLMLKRAGIIIATWNKLFLSRTQSYKTNSVWKKTYLVVNSLIVHYLNLDHNYTIA